MEDTHRYVYFWPRHPSFRRRALNTTIDEVLTAAMPEDESLYEEDSSVSSEATGRLRRRQTINKEHSSQPRPSSEPTRPTTEHSKLQTAGRIAARPRM